MTSRETDTWDAEAASFDDEADHGLHDPLVRDAWRSLLLSVVPPVPYRIADLGCGTGSISLLLVQEGHPVDGVDLSPEMVRRAVAKVGSFPGTSFVVGDAAEPALPPASYEVVLCRHVLWALPDPAAALKRWRDLLTPTGRLVLIEGNWSTGAGLTAAETLALLEKAGRPGTVTALSDQAYWGKRIDDERYLVVA
ncbi:class I SAM-dependent methyltransferase [soil metagenome]